jgi:hypothetical protein
MELLKEYVVVKVRSLYNDRVAIGKDGVKIIVNTDYNPERHTSVSGIVVSVPKVLPKVPIASDTVGMPAYYENTPYTWKTAADIEMDVRVNDKVYFHYNCLLQDTHENPYNNFYLYSKKERWGDEVVPMHYFRVKYELVFAAVRYKPMNSLISEFSWDQEESLEIRSFGQEPLYQVGETQGFYHKEVVMIGSHVFVEPDMETWEDVSVPVFESLNGVPVYGHDGRPVLKPKDKWIVTKSRLGHKYLCGWVRHTGKPLKGDRDNLKEGMYVYFRPLTDTIIRFEGKDYFRMRQRHISAYVPAKRDGGPIVS